MQRPLSDPFKGLAGSLQLYAHPDWSLAAIGAARKVGYSFTPYTRDQIRGALGQIGPAREPVDIVLGQPVDPVASFAPAAAVKLEAKAEEGATAGAGAAPARGFTAGLKIKVKSETAKPTGSLDTQITKGGSKKRSRSDQ